MGHGRASAPQNFPPLFGPYHRTEVLAAYHRYGPVRSAVMRKTFPGEATLSVNRDKSNLARLLVKTVWTGKGRQGGTTIVGLNPNLPSDVREPMGRLLERLCTLYPLRPVENDIRPDEVEAFESDEHPEVRLDAFFGTEVRTQTLVALHLLGGSQRIGRLQRSVFGKFVTRVRVAIQSYIEEGVLVKNGRVVSFNPDLPWLPELLALLEVLGLHLDKVRAHVRMQQEARSWTGSGTAHAAGQVFRVLGSRVNQAILCYLAVFGPTRIMQLCANISAVNPGAVDPLIESGLVCCIDAPGKGSTYKVGLNSAYPVYPELRTYLRTAPIVEDSLPLLDTTTMYEGADGEEPRAFEDFNPFMVFGTMKKDLATTALALIAQSPTEAVRLKGLCGLMNDYNAQSVRKALTRLEDEGLVVERRVGCILRFGLNPQYAAYEELKALLVTMGREWTFFAGAPVADPRARCAVT